VVHERHFAVDLGDRHHRLPLAARLLDHRQQIQSHVGIAAEAEPRFAIYLARGDHLSQHVDAVFHQVPRGVSVIGADVVLLLHRHVQETAGFEKEFGHFDVGRQLAVAQIACILQIGIVTEHPLDEGFQKPFFQIAGSFGRLDGNRGQNFEPRGQNFEPQFRVRFRPPVQRVHQRIGLTDSQWNTEHDSFADPDDDLLHAGIDVLEIRRASLLHDPISLGRLVIARSARPSGSGVVEKPRQPEKSDPFKHLSDRITLRGPSLIIAGTACPARSGLVWNGLH